MPTPPMLPDSFRLGLLCLAGWVVLAALVEGWVLTRRGQAYDWRATGASLGDAVGRLAVESLGLSLAAPVLAWALEHRLHSWTLDRPSDWLLLFLLQELAYYAYHRASHRVAWFWATHAVHHSPAQLTLAAALRLGWTGRLSGSAVFFAPLIWLGFPPGAVLGMVAFNLLYQFWLHATWIPPLPAWFEAVFNSPAHHRVHHASNAAYLDCNYGGVLIVFDRLFGTWVREDPQEPLRYGLVRPLDSHNPVLIALHGWWVLGQDLIRTPGAWSRLALLWQPPRR